MIKILIEEDKNIKMREEIRIKAQEILETLNGLEEGEKILLNEVEPGIYYATIETQRRGPGSLIIGDDLTYLFGSSAMVDSELLEEFKSGKRTSYNLIKEKAINEYTKKFGGFPYFLFMGANDDIIIAAIEEALKTGKEITTEDKKSDY